MKKCIAFALAFVCLIWMTSCANDSAKCIVEEDGEQCLVLPISEKKIPIEDRYKTYINRIDVDLLRIAEETIRNEAPLDAESLGFYLDERGERLYLCAEAIVEIDPPNTVVYEDGTVSSGGCGIDHEHLFFIEPIMD